MGVFIEGEAMKKIIALILIGFYILLFVILFLFEQYIVIACIAIVFFIIEFAIRYIMLIFDIKYKKDLDELTESINEINKEFNLINKSFHRGKDYEKDKTNN
jgi:glucan phosphoethanolaminetransferase (alkaline phosphatase superfamily)